jgi:hypothetical protein
MEDGMLIQLLRRGCAGTNFVLVWNFCFCTASSFVFIRSFSRDLLQVPRSDIVECLKNVPSGRDSRYTYISLQLFLQSFFVIRIFIIFVVKRGFLLYPYRSMFWS